MHLVFPTIQNKKTKKKPELGHRRRRSKIKKKTKNEEVGYDLEDEDDLFMLVNVVSLVFIVCTVFTVSSSVI